jgi:hypothetical protein
MKKTLKFRTIVCGGIVQVHASNIRKIENMEMIAWCDIVLEKANNLTMHSEPVDQIALWE